MFVIPIPFNIHHTSFRFTALNDRPVYRDLLLYNMSMNHNMVIVKANMLWGPYICLQVCLSISITLYFMLHSISDTGIYRDYCFVTWLSIMIHKYAYRSSYWAHETTYIMQHLHFFGKKIWLSSSIILCVMTQPIIDMGTIVLLRDYNP